ncbi:DUF6414 family protein [Corallococcus exiguus]|uniref:DUF6414 family protein n=1 Tax=Corallococcus exiguus TaxID=83462 RepID=UPI001470B60F|nr:hypothetical protein [Corallococcus exiguus]NNB86708.1 hypothetical protein [Corallococcus exiguus]
MLVRSFLYLDDYKLFSFSSQLFGGLTEYVVNFSSESQEHRESRDAMSGKARLVAEIASEKSGVSEKKYLHDHAYNLFEQSLESRAAILNAGKDSRLSDFRSSKFVRVSGPAIFDDAQMLRDMVVKFNDFVDALAYVSNLGKKQAMQDAVDKAGEGVKDRNELARLARQLRQFSPQSLSKEAGLRMDEEYMRRLAYLMEYGYGNQLQMQIPIEAEGGDLVFSTILKRDSLREEQGVLVKKYARLMEQRVTIVGVPTQSGGPVASLRLKDNAEPAVKVGLARAVSNLSEIELGFSGRMDNEVVIDPIAVYAEIEVPGGPV